MRNFIKNVFWGLVIAAAAVVIAGAFFWAQPQLVMGLLPLQVQEELSNKLCDVPAFDEQLIDQDMLLDDSITQLELENAQSDAQTAENTDADSDSTTETETSAPDTTSSETASASDASEETLILWTGANIPLQEEIFIDATHADQNLKAELDYRKARVGILEYYLMTLLSEQYQTKGATQLSLPTLP